MWERQNQIIRRTAHVVPAGDGTQDCFASINQGTVPSSRMAAATNPTNLDTVTIGGTAFKFVTALGAASAQVQVFIGASAAATYGSLVKAINGTSAPLEWTEATTAFAKPVLADMVAGTQLRLRSATKRGGLPLPGVSASTALAASITAGAAAWTNDNLNTMGKSPADCNEACGQFAVTAAMVAALATGVFIELPFTPTVFGFDVLQSTGAKKASILTDVMTISGNALVLASAGAVHVVAGDVLSYWASA
jgi:hypothetical protein